MSKYLLMQFLLIIVGSLQSLNAQNWLIDGNNATSSSLLGTLNSQPLVIITKNGERIRIDTFGRVGIGTSLPATSALLDLSSNVRGFLTPRMTTAQRTAIVSPVQGLLVFQTDGTRGFYYYDGTWKAVTPVTSGFATKNLS